MSHLFKRNYVIAFVALCLTLSAAPQFSPKPISPRSYQEENRQLTLLDNGQVAFQVFVPADAPYEIRAEAAEFAGLLSEICGSKVVPVNQAEPGKTKFRIGDKAFASANGIDLDKIDRDGFVIAAMGNDILIAGGDALDVKFGRGTLYGIYDFLERYAGARFYFPGKFGTILPKMTDWRVGAMTIYDRPDCQYRRIYWASLIPSLQNWWYEALDTDDIVNLQELQFKRLRSSTLDLPNCHGLAYLSYVERFAKSHPEFFALKPDGVSRHDGSVVRYPSDASGHLCFSNPDLMEVIYQDAKAVLTGQPPESRDQKGIHGNYRWYMHNRNFFNLMPNDSMARCCCKDCKPHLYQDGEAIRYSRSASLFLWDRLLAIPKRLKAENIPGNVTMMAYDLCKEPPDEQIPDNVVIQVATTGPWKEQCPEEQAKDEELLKRWVDKLGAKIYQWNYVTKCNEMFLPGIPNFTPRAVGKYYSRMYPYSFGCFLEGESDRWFFGHLNYYVYSRLMWDHETNPDQIIDEYCRLMFGVGAQPVSEVFDIIEKHWLEDICEHTIDTPVGPKHTPPTEYQRWHDIYSPDEIARIGGLFDKALDLAKADEAAQERISFVRQALWQPVVDAADAYTKNNSALEFWQANFGIAQNPPVIDGNPDDDAWKDAPQIALLPLGNDKAEVLTFVKLLADDDAFYLLFDCKEPLTDKMLKTPREFDDVMTWSDNAVEIHFDTEGKRKADYQIMVNCDGVVADLLNDAVHNEMDMSWNSNAVAKTSFVPEKGWFAEVKLPRSSFPEVQNGRIFANFTRHRILNGEQVLNFYSWCPYAKTFGDIANFGTINMTPCSAKSILGDSDFVHALLKGETQSPWFHWSKIPPRRDTEIFRTSGVSMRLDEGCNGIIQRMPQLKADTNYRLSYFVRLQDVVLKEGTDGGFYIRFDEGNGNVKYLGKEYNTMPWTLVTHVFRTSNKQPSADGKAYIHFTVRNCSGTAWLDHVELVELP